MTKFLLAGQRLLHYRQIGQGGTPVLLLHGYRDSHVTFYRLFDTLAAALRTFCQDIDAKELNP